MQEFNSSVVSLNTLTADISFSSRTSERALTSDSLKWTWNNVKFHHLQTSSTCIQSVQCAFHGGVMKIRSVSVEKQLEECVFLYQNLLGFNTITKGDCSA